jgi:gliding motility-associated lipoprotein GldD
MTNLAIPIKSTILFYILFCFSCKEVSYTPKPRMFPKISFPEYSLTEFSTSYCPFSFQFPDYWIYQKDSSFFGEKPEHECWFNLDIGAFNGSIHCSYSAIQSKSDLTRRLKDAFKMAREHQVKANYIDEIPISKKNTVFGMLYNIEGPAASPFQFYLTDSSRHFLRGSLYFNSKVRPDSIMPIAEFVKNDILKMLYSFEWKN